MFGTLALLIYHPPPGSQAAVWDVAEAYRTVALKPSQWPDVVIRLNDDNSFAINTSTRDATADILQSQGISPMSKWVDDNIFICILKCHLPNYNQQQSEQAIIIARMEGASMNEGRYGTKVNNLRTTALKNLTKICCPLFWICLEPLLNQSMMPNIPIVYRLASQPDTKSNTTGLIYFLNRISTQYPPSLEPSGNIAKTLILAGIGRLAYPHDHHMTSMWPSLLT